ncbi:MAG: hypothetical protein ACI3VK_06290 [Oscillospiraceae bacterium]
MKKRFFSILLCLCMVLMLFTATGFVEVPGDNERIDITMTGFKLGNTPADCKITNIDSTITVGSVTEVAWWMHDEEGAHTMRSTDVFEAGATYEIGILLDSGLPIGTVPSSVPDVTVNGKTASATYAQSVTSFDIRCTFDMFEITINAPDAVCVLQDLEFTVTAPEGVTLDKEFAYDTGMMGSGADLTLDDDGVGHGVMRAEWYDLHTYCFDLFVQGSTADGTLLSATKHVEVTLKHIFVDGVCGCGTKQQYTVTYDPGEYGTGSIEPGVKTYDVPFTLSSETFERKDYVQTGWTDANGYMYFSLGDTLYADEDVTLYPMWDEIVTLTVPFTTTVKLGGNAAPGETVFTLEVVGANAGEETYADVTVSAAVTTNGEGDYEGTMTLTGPSQQLWNMLCEGAFVQQVNAGEEGWTYDDTVWGLLLSEIAAYSTADSAYDFTVLVFPAICEETENGVYYDLDWEAMPVERMSFTNTYTKTITEPEESDPNNGDNNVVETGDSRNVGLWFALLVVSTVVLVITGVHSKPRRSSRTK